MSVDKDRLTFLYKTYDDIHEKYLFLNTRNEKMDYQGRKNKISILKSYIDTIQEIYDELDNSFKECSESERRFGIGYEIRFFREAVKDLKVLFNMEISELNKYICHNDGKYKYGFFERGKDRQDVNNQSNHYRKSHGECNVARKGLLVH